MEEIKVIEALERLTNSVNGCPRFKVVFTDGSVAFTEPDADCSYGITNFVDQECRIKVTFGRNGRITHIHPA